MAVVLYRKGSTHIVRGVKCESCKFEPFELESQLKNGWHLSPEELCDDVQDDEEKESEVKEEVEAEEDKEDKEVLEKRAKTIEDMDNDEIRELARTANIEKWETARIATLKRKLINGR